ncbi:hypothetical protein [Mycoplasma sp. P36-A1]|uniref:hypothetical protein n=1 Tax=Mycoplasma sp. P36-A1 TaxID=3252900 RepID=UPI003C2E0395
MARLLQSITSNKGANKNYIISTIDNAFSNKKSLGRKQQVNHIISLIDNALSK